MTDWLTISSILTLVIGFLGTIGAFVSPYLGKEKRLLISRVISDEPVVHKEVVNRVRILFDNDPNPIENVNLLVLSLKSAGTTAISANDYNPSITFSFKDREVLGITDVKTEPDKAIMTLADVHSSMRGKIPGYVRLPTSVALNPRQTVRLSVLLRGSKKQVEILGGIDNGRVRWYEEQKKLSPKKYWTAGIGVFLIVVGLAVGAVNFLRSSYFPPDPSCASGTITIGGGTGVVPFITKAAQKYKNRCPHTSISITISASGSKDGIADLEAGHIDIAESGLGSHNLGLVDHPIAIVPYVIVVSQDIPIKNLTTNQLQDIYDGKITNWNQVGDPISEPITVVSRTSTSGTRAILEQYVLRKPETLPQNSPTHLEVSKTELVIYEVNKIAGAIGYADIDNAINSSPSIHIVTIDNYSASLDNINSGHYLFWATEHLYTQGNPSGLTQKFLDYMTSNPDVEQIRQDSHYINFNAVSTDIKNKHPSFLQD